MTIKEAVYRMSFGILIRHEEFMPNLYCCMNTDGTIEDPELGRISEKEFLDYYKYFEDGWYVYEG